MFYKKLHPCFLICWILLVKTILLCFYALILFLHEIFNVCANKLSLSHSLSSFQKELSIQTSQRLNEKVQRCLTL